MMTHFNKLTPAEAERLALLMEEMGEAQQVIGKILRHGFDSSNPTISVLETNRWMLEKELGDVLYAIGLLQTHDLRAYAISKRIQEKNIRIWKYLHHQAAPDGESDRTTTDQ